MTLRLALFASGLMFTAACDGSSKDDSSANGDDGSGDDGTTDGKGDNGPGGDAGPGGDPGGAGDGAGDWSGGFGPGLIGSGGYCDIEWWATSGSPSSASCDGCDFTWDVDGSWDGAATSCTGKTSGSDISYVNGHMPDYYVYNGTPYDGMAFSYDGTNWYFNGFVYDGGGGTGYVYYRYVGKYFGKGYYYMFHGYGSY